MVPVSLVPDGTARELSLLPLGHLVCPPTCNNNSGVPVQFWAVRHDVPVSLVPRIVGLITTRRKMGTTWMVVLAGAPYRVFMFTLQGYKSIDCRPLTII
jgi:hypothetical protein